MPLQQSQSDGPFVCCCYRLIENAVMQFKRPSSPAKTPLCPAMLAALVVSGLPCAEATWIHQGGNPKGQGGEFGSSKKVRPGGISANDQSTG